MKLIKVSSLYCYFYVKNEDIKVQISNDYNIAYYERVKNRTKTFQLIF